MIELNGHIIKQNKFPDGTLLMKYEKGYFPNHNTITWKYENDGEMFAVMCLANHIREHNAGAYIELDMPYLPNARQDRVKSDEDVFTLKYFCNFINSLCFDKVIVTDVHSNVGLALLDRVVERKPVMSLWNVLDTIPVENPLVCFYPDEGAMKRYSDTNTAPYAYGIKKRNWETGAIESLELAGAVDKIAGADVLIIDDICSRGGTFYHSAKALKEAGAANIYLYITHCEDTIHEGELLKDNDLIKHIYTTDSILTKPHNKITIV